jgi:hypothetical protein
LQQFSVKPCRGISQIARWGSAYLPKLLVSRYKASKNFSFDFFTLGTAGSGCEGGDFPEWYKWVRLFRVATIKIYVKNS